MMKVTLSGPARIGGARKRPGDVVDVDPVTLRHLEAAGVIAADPDATRAVAASTPVGAMTQADFEAAVAATAKVLAETMLDAALEEVVATVEAEKNAALARAIEAEMQRDMLQARVEELQHILAEQTDTTPAAAAAETSSPAAAPAAKPTRKSGGAAKG
ncbi:hypothetical protein [Ruixingdingia sedimenti]|uniref:DUF7210 domain-containing protein n=1 Tax=Ruixingdingia sedimenti TaxID=3073604 RepID=A0ABU1FFP4_9RHOB|nr:hypothetical protein [Xinfangfangia sp. LG-4]MDR5655403.1 hypothetical protein [Xinfangfangia sp. LG-4]